MQPLDPKLSGYYRHAAVVLKLIRFAVLLGFVMFSLFSIMFFKENITVDNMRYLLKYLDLSASDSTPSKAEISIASDESSAYTLLGNDLAVISERGVGLYDFAGNKLYQYEHTYGNAAYATGQSKKNMLVHDTGSGKLAVYNTVSKVLEKELDYPVKAVSINDLGYFAVINSEKTYRSGVLVFDPEGQEIFRWMSPDKYLTSTALNANAASVLCSAVSGAGGAFHTDLVVYNTATGEKQAETSLEDALVLKAGYANNDSSIFVLTDTAFICYDKDLNFVGSHSYNPENAKFFRVFEDLFLIAESGNLSGNAMTVTGYGYNAALLFEISSENRIIDADYVDNTLYLLEKDALSVYDYGTAENTLTPLLTLPAGKQYRAVRADAYARFILIGAKSAERNSLASLLELS